MNPIIKFSLLGTAILSLSACATTPKTDTLFTGINASQLNNATSGAAKLNANDPTCQTFYANAVTFRQAAAQPNPGNRILANTALSTLGSLASVAVGGLGIGSTVGQVAARTAASTTTRQAGAQAINGLKSNDPTRQKIQAAADQLGCPISFP